MELLNTLLANPLLSFALTSLIIEITPGPNMAYLAALSLSQGMRTGFAAVAGIALGLAVYGAAATLGLSAVIDNSRLLYEAMRWAGVGYLVWLAWDAWATEQNVSPDATNSNGDIAGWAAFRRGLITNLLNPKAAVFYVTVLPEFVQPDRGSLAMQTLMLGVLYVAIATLIHSAVVALAGAMQSTIDVANNRRTIRGAFAIALVGIAIWFAVATGHPR